MSQRRRRLQETARMLRIRLNDLRTETVTELRRPMHEVAVQAVRANLTEVGQQLSRMAIY